MRSDPTTNVNPFSPNLWLDGEWANPSRPIPQPVDGQQTIVVLDSVLNQGGFSKGDLQNPNGCIGNCASWTFDSNTYYTFVNGSTADSWAKWQPSGIPDGGIHEIYVYVPGVNATSWQAPYTIRNASGTVIGSAVIDQEGFANQWVSIGMYYLTPGATVRLSDATGEGQGTHCGAGVYCRIAADDV